MQVTKERESKRKLLGKFMDRIRMRFILNINIQVLKIVNYLAAQGTFRW